MSPLRALFISAGFAVTVLVVISAINVIVDPMCYYRCETVEVGKRTANTYYQIAQKTKIHSNVEQVILASSRGETSSPVWLEGVTGLRTLNLSAGGAELVAKSEFLRFALQADRLKRVIWYADYFELIPETIDIKAINTPALRSILDSRTQELISEWPANSFASWAASLIDHHTFEASLRVLGGQADLEPDRGSGSDIDIETCLSDSFHGKETDESLQREIDLIYGNYTRRILAPEQSSHAFAVFSDTLKGLRARGLEVVVVIIPYHPRFRRDLAEEYPRIYSRHIEWIGRIEKLRTSGVRVLNYFSGIPEDDGSPAYWNDGVHFTCKGAIRLLRPLTEARSPGKDAAL